MVEVLCQDHWRVHYCIQVLFNLLSRTSRDLFRSSSNNVGRRDLLIFTALAFALKLIRLEAALIA